MPNLLKKKKGNSSSIISRIFSDLQTSPKRGGSLVVETGFPTSIIDLFVKNRDRLKKKKQPTKTTTIEEKEKENEVEVCLVSDLELEVKRNENTCVELDNKCYKVEGDDGNERLDRGNLGNKVSCVNGLMGLCVLYSKWFDFVGKLFVFQWVWGCLDVVRKVNLLKFRFVFDGVIRRDDDRSRAGFEHVQLEIINEEDGCGVDVSDCDVKGEIEDVVELNDSKRGSENECKCCEMVNENGKKKKGKKFWKRNMFNHITIKRMKHSKKGNACIVSDSSAVDKEGKCEEKKMGSDEMNDKFVEQREENHSRCNEKRNISVKSCRVVVYQGLNLECLVVMVIVLVGLITSRMLALLITFISCVGFKLIRNLQEHEHCREI